VIKVQSKELSLRKRLGRGLLLLRTRSGLVAIGRAVLRAVFGITPLDRAKGIVGSRLIYPLSPFHVGKPPFTHFAPRSSRTDPWIHFSPLGPDPPLPFIVFMEALCP
jgi:hypothetical protein